MSLTLQRFIAPTPWVYIFKKDLQHGGKTFKWAVAAWTPRWKTNSQSINYIPENFCSGYGNGDWVKHLWRVSRKLEKGEGKSVFGTDLTAKFNGQEVEIIKAPLTKDLLP
eukprot:NODE_11656_length_440_cov_30.063091_g11000_i0.p1 GENE.NODE_11656_length_440_cov_30.063091_g11000_i0~~NODE_11656_length_440_cov_30.063091_g11000_i0.p1  ORF type:complete len:110 (-),score=15.18 NODE_11656_length_440_cov_30.063091_g11000_i0:59-388(-)